MNIDINPYMSKQIFSTGMFQKDLISIVQILSRECANILVLDCSFNFIKIFEIYVSGDPVPLMKTVIWYHAQSNSYISLGNTTEKSIILSLFYPNFN